MSSLRLGKAELRRHAVVDAEPGEPGVGERLKRRRHVRRAAAAVEPAAVHEDRRRERPGTVGHVQVEQQRVTAGLAVLDAFLIGGQKGSADSTDDGEDGRFH